MRKKEIMAILSLILVSGGFVVGDIHDYNTQSDAIKYECIKIDSPTDKIEKLSKECEENKRQIYIEDQVNKLREEKRLEEERKRQEDELRRQEELRRQQEEQLNNIGIVNRGGDVNNIRVEEVLLEISHYCKCKFCCNGATGITASGKPVQSGLTIALPKNIPFGTKVKIDGDPNIYENMDTGNYIVNTRDSEGRLVIRCDIYVSSHSEALEKGRFKAKGWLIYEN